ncbi:MAG: hypothetical protein H0T79_13260 [Deltaproteobacteria bacterium]|nr:hypothetical protein [Deltaproteobacteria bacterium]
MSTRDPATARRALDHLLACGDWAAANDEVGTLAFILKQLVKHVSQQGEHTVESELVALLQMCRADAARATQRWSSVRSQLHETSASDDLQIALPLR